MIKLISDNPSVDAKERVWALDYHDWGAAAATGSSFYKASRPTALTSASSMPTTTS